MDEPIQLREPRAVVPVDHQLILRGMPTAYVVLDEELFVRETPAALRAHP